jgi:hypothetical protein
MQGKWLLLFVMSFHPSSTLLGAGPDPCSQLANAKSFAFFATVTTGTVVSGTKAFSQVLHRPSPVVCFEQLITTGNSQAKMYAMLGLRQLDRTRFDIELERLKKQSFGVVVLATVQQGALQTERSGALLKQIADGGYRKGFEFCRQREVRLD